jgi:CheY-like chemotaxis protein
MADLAADENLLALVIEDSRAVGEIFKIAIERVGFEVELIPDGQVALERLAAVIPVFILLDLHLPNVSGEEILDYIHAQPRLAKTRVVLASADLMKATSLKDKVDLVLIKPVGFNELCQVARQVRQAEPLLGEG